MLIKIAQQIISYEDVKYMFDNPSPDSWNPKVKTAPSYGLYLYDMCYDEADLILPITEHKLKEPTFSKDHTVNFNECSLDLKKEIIKQRMKNRKIALDARTTKSIEKIKKYELLKSIKT